MTRHSDAPSHPDRSRPGRSPGARFGALAVLPILLLAACGRLGPGPAEPEGVDGSSALKSRPGDERVVARLDGRDVTLGEVHRYMQEQFLDELLRQPEAELYSMRERAIGDMAQRYVIETAAAERGLTTDALFEEITSAAPATTPDDVSQWYAENEGRLRGARFEDIAPRIQELLDEQARSEAWDAFLAPRLAALDWAVTIEPPRATLEPTRLVRGAEDAPITLMAFSDYQCPYCIRSEPVLAEVLQRYPQQVRLIHRHFPLDNIHPFARPASEAAMCADEQGRFWDFHDAIFARGGRLSEESFLEIGRELDLDLEALGQCIDERRHRDFVERDFVAGQTAGVTGTPAFFVNGIALRGAQDADAIGAVIDAELARLEAD